jgi:glycosyltransferase involved in cell wall biosynthesis
MTENRFKKKSLLARVWRELKLPFTRRFWDRQREKRLLRRIAGGAGQHAAPPADMKTWQDVQAKRAKVPVLAGIEKPIAMIIDDRLPEPDRDSGSLDAVNMISSLINMGYHVIYAVKSPREQEARYTQALLDLGAVNLTKADAASLNVFIERHGLHVDLFVLNRVSAGGEVFELVRYNCPNAKIIFNTVDLHYIREARAANLSGDHKALSQSERTRAREEFLVSKSDMTLVVSSVENEILQASVPGSKIAVVPLARPVRRPGIGFEKRGGIGFIGGFQHAPNVDAIRYFLTAVWPLVHAKDPDIKFEIVGSDFPDDLVRNLPAKVNYLGVLPEVESWFDTLRMTVAPLRIGAGAKGKIASSLCNGLPCVISSVAAEGMGFEHGDSVLVADSPEAMATEILRLHSDPALWRHLAARAEDVAEQRLSIRSFDAVIRETLVRMELPICG